MNTPFLEACPGSGKTEVVSAKVAKEISSWDKYPGGIAILSFTNSATDELTHRISTHLLQAKVMFPPHSRNI
ncbi:UvrD-helicase domain-containing protein [Aeromonas dhakensis]|uniref:UvrD-helicase domain-containing protein n=1 Tax=Aeromonas dhakensis TaxID=196024 RepID=UPI002442679E|nr:UvrD-helicase domain-containing protein [Aeromonas dhakensis]